MLNDVDYQFWTKAFWTKDQRIVIRRYWLAAIFGLFLVVLLIAIYKGGEPEPVSDPIAPAESSEIATPPSPPSAPTATEVP